MKDDSGGKLQFQCEKPTPPPAAASDEQRAREILAAVLEEDPATFTERDDGAAITLIAQALAASRKDEREECARVADGFSWFETDGEEEWNSDCPHKIAAAIRSRV